jgi:S1-C subfamily serine protease
MKKFIGILGIAILGGISSLTGYRLLFEKPVYSVQEKVSPFEIVNANYYPAEATAAINEGAVNFVEAADKTVHAVVHVKNTAIRTQTNSFEDLFYGNGNGNRKYEQIGTGSGVIISADGYIITNNHVIADANDLEITLNNQKKYKAELIGTDTKNDIALLKITADIELPYIPFANSDMLQIGEWVLAVGNPYNLTSTVTAGIVSAKGRDLEGNNNIESFIQTDAAVNPGNSGGALVNTRGELVGINTAISSRTGSFIGYSFAVPSNIAKKVIDDILEFGKVQEAILGISIDSKHTEEGVKIEAITEEGKGNGLEIGDVIVQVDHVKISKFSELKGQLTAKRPGEYVALIINRNDKLLTKYVQLSKIIERFISSSFQWELKDITKADKKERGISNGVKIIRTGNDKTESNMVGLVITKINGDTVTGASTTAELLDELAKTRYRIALETINPNGEIKEYIYAR